MELGSSERLAGSEGDEGPAVARRYVSLRMRWRFTSRSVPVGACVALWKLSVTDERRI